MKLLIMRFLTFCGATFRYVVEKEGSLKAAALAYATLFSIIPLMVFSITFLSVFPAFEKYFLALHRFLFHHLMPASAHIIQHYVEMFARNATNLSITGLLFFLFTAVILIFSMESVFNSIWQVKSRRKGFPAFLMYWAVLTLLPPMGGLAFASTLFLSSIPYISAIVRLSALFVPFIVSWLGCIFLYSTLPNCKELLSLLFYSKP
jgi:membrane protein